MSYPWARLAWARFRGICMDRWSEMAVWLHSKFQKMNWRRVATWAFLAFVLTMLVLNKCRADARSYVQDGARDRALDILMLSRVAVSESGFSHMPDHRAILAVLLDVQKRYSYEHLYQAAQKYSARATGRKQNRRKGRRWISQLSFDGKEPKDWPKKWGSWSVFQNGWLRTVRNSRRAIAESQRAIGRYRGGCSQAPHHWGGEALKADRKRLESAIERGVWAVVSCPGAKNRFVRRLHTRVRLRGLRDQGQVTDPKQLAQAPRSRVP